MTLHWENLPRLYLELYTPNDDSKIKFHRILLQQIIHLAKKEEVNQRPYVYELALRGGALLKNRGGDSR